MLPELSEKLANLKLWLSSQNSLQVAYSGGIDSSLLLYLVTELTTKTPNQLSGGVFADSVFMAEKQRQQALYFSEQIKASLEIIKWSPLANKAIKSNTNKRCYHCKKTIYTKFQQRFPRPILIIDGTNTDDLLEDRPGLLALRELKIATPFVYFDFSKNDIIAISKKLKLPSCNLYPDSCLATRLPRDQEINKEGLEDVEKLEIELAKLGFKQYRAKPCGDKLIIQLKKTELQLFTMEIIKAKIARMRKDSVFSKVFLDISS